jgi:hypothetical protein
MEQPRDQGEKSVEDTMHMPNAFKAARIFDNLVAKIQTTANEEEDSNSRQQILS